MPPMSNNATRHDGADATRRDATGGDLIVSVADAADLLGISAGAVRKRLERGQLAGRKVGGQWQIVLTAVDATGHVVTDATRRDATVTTETTRPDATPPAVSVAARAQLSAIVEEMIAPLVARHEERVADMGRAIGRLEAERDALRVELERVRAGQDTATTQPEAQHATEPSRPTEGPWWQKWWRRVVADG